jgi:hypothetical protein
MCLCSTKYIKVIKGEFICTGRVDSSCCTSDIHLYVVLRPVVTIKVFFVKENFDKVFNETLSVWEAGEVRVAQSLVSV